MPETIRVLTWNINCFTPERSAHKGALLRDLDWDVALLQEVSRSAIGVIADEIGDCSYIDGLRLVEKPSTGRAHGCAVITRYDRVLSGPAFLIPRAGGGPPERSFAERAVGAEMAVGDRSFTACSWHAAHAQGKPENLIRKMRGYAALSKFAAKTRPLIIGMDGNVRDDSTELRVPDPKSNRPDEHAFHGVDPAHGMVDAFRSFLDAHPDERRRVNAMRQGDDTPLALTHITKGGNRPRYRRMDRIYISPEFTCTEIRHEFADAVMAGSDHAYVLATLEFAGTR
ncbi:MAG TPA: endonuclease/exonuclease/phosphatase family protein [Acidimicrobiia bacterium]|nr:endonuclease/exonuclease/phosphatase family protein [Acidimicrobiia bacterium]